MNFPTGLPVYGLKFPRTRNHPGWTKDMERQLGNIGAVHHLREPDINYDTLVCITYASGQSWFYPPQYVQPIPNLFPLLFP